MHAIEVAEEKPKFLSILELRGRDSPQNQTKRIFVMKEVVMQQTCTKQW